MTLTEITIQIHDLTVDGQINGERFSRQELAAYIHGMLRTGNELCIETRLPDGPHYCRIYKVPRSGLDYEYLKAWPY